MWSQLNTTQTISQHTSEHRAVPDYSATDRCRKSKYTRAGRRNETRINIAITDSRDFPALNRRAYIFVRPALSSACLIKVLYQATSLLRLLDAAEENSSVYLARNINYLIGPRSSPLLTLNKQARVRASRERIQRYEQLVISRNTRIRELARAQDP